MKKYYCIMFAIFYVLFQQLKPYKEKMRFDAEPFTLSAVAKAKAKPKPKPKPKKRPRPMKKTKL